MIDLIRAASLIIRSCEPTCPCQSVNIVFRDDAGDGFAAASMPPEDARRMAADLLNCADVAEANQLKQQGRLG